MNKICFLAAVIILLIAQSQSFSQSQDPPKFEVAAEFTTLERDAVRERTEPGLGGRFTFNFNKNLALEAAGYFFPKHCFDCRNAGRITEVVGGVKAGKRFEKWGIFGKARPGFVSFSDGEFKIVPTGTGGPFPFRIEVNRLTSFATDLGAVVEFYPSRRIVTRFDAGNTIIYSPQRTTHNFQFMTSVGFRF